jgi:hypothetical protein
MTGLSSAGFSVTILNRIVTEALHNTFLSFLFIYLFIMMEC